MIAIDQCSLIIFYDYYRPTFVHHFLWLLSIVLLLLSTIFCGCCLSTTFIDRFWCVLLANFYWPFFMIISWKPLSTVVWLLLSMNFYGLFTSYCCWTIFVNHFYCCWPTFVDHFLVTIFDEHWRETFIDHFL